MAAFLDKRNTDLPSIYQRVQDPTRLGRVRLLIEHGVVRIKELPGVPDIDLRIERWRNTGSRIEYLVIEPAGMSR